MSPGLHPSFRHDLMTEHIPLGSGEPVRKDSMVNRVELVLSCTRTQVVNRPGFGWWLSGGAEAEVRINLCGRVCSSIVSTPPRFQVRLFIFSIPSFSLQKPWTSDTQRVLLRCPLSMGLVSGFRGPFNLRLIAHI
jgi:hypothetical protein